MLLVSLMLALLVAPTLLVRSESMPTIFKYEDYFYTPLTKTKIKNLRLECLARGRPDPDIEFYFHLQDLSYGTLLQNLPRVKNISRTEIEIQNVSANDAGTYRCVARNRHGRDFKEKRILVAVPGSFYTNSRYEDPPAMLEVELGREQEIICPVKKKPYPLKFAWGSKPKRGQRRYFVDQDERVQITENGGLYFSFITQSDVDNINNVGGISCIMYHEGQPIYSRRHKLKVVRQNTSYAAPSLHVKLPGVTYLMKGEGKTLRCIGGGNPVPYVTWFKDGVQITINDSKYEMDNSKPGLLKIRSFEPSMTGNYKCALSNRLGSIHSDGNVILATVPIFKKPFEEMSAAYRDNRLELQCEARGTMPIRYEWYKNGRLLTPYQTFESRMMINGAKILISPVTDTIEGTYQCYAINSYGNSYTKTRVFVQDPVVPTARKRDAPKEKPTTVAKVVVTESAGRMFEIGGPLQLKYIIIIACSGAVCLVLIGGAICMCCRSKEDRKKIIYVPTAERQSNGVHCNNVIKRDLSRLDLKQQLLFDLANLPPPPPSLTDHSDDDFSSYGGYNSIHPLYYNDNNTMMSLIRHNKDGYDETL